MSRPSFRPGADARAYGVGAVTTDGSTIKNHAAFIWSVADLLRGDYRQSEYGRVILPLTVLRRLDAVLAPVKAEMLTKYDASRARSTTSARCSTL